ncbi:MAG: metallophosphoesterase [Victivallales bacterium]|nr:metallophosphoesterase [Victivallales bacterium]
MSRKQLDWNGFEVLWKVFLGLGPLAQPQDFCGKIPDSMTDGKGGRTKPVAIAMKDGVLDFLPVLGLKRGTAMEFAMAYCELDCAKEGLFRLGVGGDWWYAVYVNGKCVINRLGTGNGCENVGPDNHIIDVPFRAGSSLVAIYARSGSNGFRFAWAPRPGADVTEAVSPIQTLRSLRKPLPQLLAGPWLMNPDVGRMSIAFISHGIQPGGVDLRLHGSRQPWKRIWHQECGHLITRDEHHQIDLTGLRPGARYDYRVFLRDPATREETFFPGKTAFRTFRVPDRESKTCKYLAFGDLQFPREQRLKFIEDFYRNGKGAQCDFIVTLGDMNDGIGDFENDVARDYLQFLAKLTKGEQPIVFVRGNHELRGDDRVAWGRYFHHPSGNTYYQFRYGETAFLVLDAWEDKPAMYDPKMHPYCTLNDDEAFISAERQWLFRAVRTKEFRTAARRIVLSHYGYFSLEDVFHFMTDNFRGPVERLFGGAHPLHPLAFWLCGHTHLYTRSIPGTSAIRSFGDHKPAYATSPDAKYTVAAISGPHRAVPGGCPQTSAFLADIAPGVCKVQGLDSTGAVFDEFQVSDDGTLLSENTSLQRYEV